MSVRTDRVIPGGNRARYQGGIYDRIWKKRIGIMFPVQFEWYRDNNLCLLPSQTFVWGGFIFITQSHADLYGNRS